MRLRPDVFRDWGGGVITSLRPDEIPPNASPHGHNAALLSVAGGRAVVGKRRGARLFNLSRIEDSGSASVITSLHQFTHLSSGTQTHYRLGTTLAGKIFTLDSAGDETVVAAAGELGNDLPTPLWVTAGNRAFVANRGHQRKIVDLSGALTVQNVGIERPDGDEGNINITGTAGSMTGDYELAIAFYNVHTNQESSLSDPVAWAGVTNATLLVNTSLTPDDPQVTHVRIYIRKTNPVLLPFFTRVNNANHETGTDDYDPAAGGWPVESTAGNKRYDVSDALILTHLTVAPSTVENDPPPDDTRGFVFHTSRLIGFNQDSIFWSKLDQLESFDPEATEPVNPEDGQELVALHPASENVLLIFKRGATYGLFGTDPNTWEIRLIDPSVGCVSPTSIVTIEGRTYWWSVAGPVAWSGGVPQQIGYALIAPTIDPAVLNVGRWDRIVADVDLPRQRLAFHVATAGSDQNDLTLPFNFRAGVWESTKWDPFDIASAGVFEDGSGRPWVYYGGYNGFVYQWWTADVDGPRASAVADFPNTQLTGTAEDAGGNPNALVDSTANWNVDGSLVSFHVEISDATTGETVRRRIVDAGAGVVLVFDGDPYVVPAGSQYRIDLSLRVSGTLTAGTTPSVLEDTLARFDNQNRLVGLPVYVWTGDFSAFERRTITDVDEFGTLTLDAPLVTVPEEGWLYVIAGPTFEWDTKWEDNGDPFAYKRYRFVHAMAFSGEGNTTAHIDIFMDTALDVPGRRFTLPVFGSGAVFDLDRFDESVFGDGHPATIRQSVDRRGRTYRLRVRHFEPNRQLILLKLGMEGNLQTSKA